MLRSLFLGTVLTIATMGAAWAAGDAAAGEKVFKAQCSICHSPVAGKNAIGPSLFGVVGRKAGTVDGYAYSAANKNSGLTWDDATLDKYLTKPNALVPGTKMTFAGLKNDEQRADVIAYLATLH
jgi:cytochrome c